MTNDILEKIGYGRPPKKYQFKKGQSGNPGGRPKGSKSADDLVIENLRKRMPARINGRSITTSLLDGVIKAQAKKALEGDTKAAKYLTDLIHEAEERKYYMETAVEYLNRQITKALSINEKGDLAFDFNLCIGIYCLSRLRLSSKIYTTY